MPEAQQTTSDEAGVTRTPTGTIVDQNTSIPPSTPEPPKEAPKQESKPSTTQPKTEAKSDGKDTAKETKDSSKSLLNEKSEEPKGAPANYTDFTVPEGFTLDPEIAKEASTLFRELDLNQSGSQKLVDFYVAKTKEAFEAPFNAYMEKRQEWRNEINDNPEIGGSKLNATKASIGKLIDSFGKYAEGFRNAMDYTGAGDNPDVVGALFVLSKLLTEGAAVRGNGPSSEGQRAPGVGRPSAAQALYPNLPTSSR